MPLELMGKLGTWADRVNSENAVRYVRHKEENNDRKKRVLNDKQKKGCKD